MIGIRSHRKLSRRGLLVPVTFPRSSRSFRATLWPQPR